MAHCCWELFPIMDDVVDVIAIAVGLPVGATTLNVSIHEDNAGALILAVRHCHRSLFLEVNTMQ